MDIPIPNVISWPLGGIDEHGRHAYTEGDRSVREVISNILLTRPGERLMRADFGAGLTDFIHQPNNETTRSLMANVVRKAVEQWETRVQIEGVRVDADPQDVSMVHVVVRYHMRHSRLSEEMTLHLSLV